MNKLEKYLENYQSKLLNKIHKVAQDLTLIEINMLKTLNNNFLLLDVDYEADELYRKVLVAYNLNRQIILWKKLYTQSNDNV
jgi:hypothetical protein